MNLTILLNGVQEDLEKLAELGDERVEQIARRLADSVGSSLRLKLLDLLAQAAVEVSSKLPSGHVEIRLAGEEPEFVYVDTAGEASGAFGEELSARITLRLSDNLKLTVEKAADREGVSTNTWIVRAIARAAESRPARAGGKRLSGYAQS
ncbi:MAG TPA: YlcI/YnfO family protein [Gaiellaceae bacterium]|nr:YlcI/YnfO family protein [Gaiellaceae bacterium]